MRALFLVPFVLSACTTQALVIAPGDTGGDTSSTGDDTDTNDTHDTDTNPPPPKTWTGQRDFDFDAGCRDTVYEQGTEVTTDPSYAQVVSTCAECDMVFHVTASPDTICSGYVSIDTDIYRGVQYTGANAARIFLIFDDGNGNWYKETLADGKDDGSGTLTYQYDDNYYGYTYQVDGQATIQ